MKYCYGFQFGDVEYHLWDLDDRKARRWASTWIRMFWGKHAQYIHDNFPGSIADYVVNPGNWYRGEFAQCTIVRWACEGSVIPCTKPVCIEKFELNPEAITEFVRVYK